MKEYYIEINETQPLWAIEKKLQEMGYVSDKEWNSNMRDLSYNCVYTYSSGEYLLHMHDGKIGDLEVLTLTPSIQDVLEETERIYKELGEAFETLRRRL